MSTPILVTPSSAASFLKSKTVKTGTLLMSANAKCAHHSLAYGQCMIKNNATNSKEGCLDEFMAYKKCVQKNLGKGL